MEVLVDSNMLQDLGESGRYMHTRTKQVHSTVLRSQLPVFRCHEHGDSYNGLRKASTEVHEIQYPCGEPLPQLGATDGFGRLIKQDQPRGRPDGNALEPSGGLQVVACQQQ